MLHGGGYGILDFRNIIKGIELYLLKTRGRLTGSVGYSILNTSAARTNENGDQPVYEFFNNPLHGFSIGAVYELTREWKLSGIFSFLPSGDVVISPLNTTGSIPYYPATDGKGSYKLANQRLDIGTTYRPF